VCGLAQFVRVRDFLASRERQERMEAGINAYRCMASMGNGVGLRIDKETEIPPRRPLHDTATFDPTLGKVLRMEPHMAYAWNVDTLPIGRFEGIRKWNTRQLIALAFEAGLLGEFFVAPLPGNERRVEHALQGMAWDAELFAVIGQKIVEGFLTVIDTVFGILFDFPDSPIPDPAKLEQPGIEVLRLRGIETELELSLDHATPVSDFRCIA
jgi:hypothetical protein